MSQSLSEKILAVMAEKFDIDPEKLSTTTDFEAMDVDSLVLVELSVIIENQYQVTVNETELEQAGNVAGVARLLAERGVSG